jgi:DNA-binding NarL/FixJ family response regulator
VVDRHRRAHDGRPGRPPQDDDRGQDGDPGAGRHRIAQAGGERIPDGAGERLAPELRRQREAGAGRLLDRMGGLGRGAAAPGAGRGPWRTTTPREVTLLELLPTHLSYAQIGERLYLSVDTVKGKPKSLYPKLEVGSRAEAVEAATTLGLIVPKAEARPAADPVAWAHATH